MKTEAETPDPLEESRRIVKAAQERQVTLRLIGGLGIRFHCHGEHSTHLREYHDIDLFGLGKQYEKIGLVFQGLGYSPNIEFNLLYGSTRLQFAKRSGEKHVDVFLDRFIMEHTLDFRQRLALDELTIPITDLLLTKLQIEDLDEKDVKDMIAVLEDHEIGHSDDREILNVDYIARLCSGDWGLYKTITDNLDWMIDSVGKQSSPLSGNRELLQKLETIDDYLKASKKNLRWKIRSVFGERMKWYEQVEEGEGEM